MIDFVDRLFTSAAPLIIASIGALLTELAGVLGIFTEGFMSAGAFFFFFFTVRTGSPFSGMMISASAAGLAGWALARFVRKTHANPFIAGLVVNIAAGGITEALSTLWFGTKGVLRNPDFAALQPLNIPVMQRIPFLGSVVSGHEVSVYVSWFIVIAASLFIRRSSPGMRLRVSGLSPQAAKERGIRPGLYWEAAWAASAFLAAIAGAFLCFRIGAYTPGGVAGRGWISLAAVYLGFRNAGGVFAAAIVFALAEMSALALQGFAKLPATALLGLPHALALLLYVLSRWVRKKRLTPKGITP
jgi:simple sugar transport system permease protein